MAATIGSLDVQHRAGANAEEESVRAFWGFGLAVFIMGCTRTALLYPANDSAAQIGVLKATYVASGTGHSEVEIKMPDGEILKGAVSIVRGGTIGFGTLFASVYGSRGVTTGSAASTTVSIPGGSPGTAAVFGNQGTYGECEFINDNWSGHGYGACELSHKGQGDMLYRLEY